MKNPLELVTEFHKTFDHPILPLPAIPSEKRCELRISLLAEELKELQQAIADGDIVEIADAFSDLQYVLSGAILEFGMGGIFADLFGEVHRSNMSKACSTLEEAKQTQDNYLPVRSHVIEREGFYFVYRDADEKTLKSINYSPADLKKFL